MEDRWMYALEVLVYGIGFLVACVVLLPPLAFMAYIMYAIITL